jgi:hypothetical protein
MVEALSSWSTWALVLGTWFAASAVSALVLAKFLRRAQGKHAKSAPAVSEISEESERTSVVPPGFFSDFVDEPSRAGEAAMTSTRIEATLPDGAPRHSGTRFKPIAGQSDEQSARKLG